MKVVEVRQLFVLGDQRHILAVLASFDWECSLGARVELRRGPSVLLARYSASGNHGDAAVAQLTPLDPWEHAESIVRQLLDSEAEPITLTCAGS